MLCHQRLAPPVKLGGSAVPNAVSSMWSATFAKKLGNAVRCEACMWKLQHEKHQGFLKRAMLPRTLLQARFLRLWLC